MKVVVVHPPMYPVNHEFYNKLAKKIDLVVFQIGEHPQHHTSWDNDTVRKGDIFYKLKIFSSGPVTTLKTLNPLFIKEVIKENPDIVMSVAFWIPSLYISILRKITKGFKFIILTNAIPQTESDVKGMKKYIRQLIAQNVDLFISASELTTEYLQSTFPNKDILVSTQTMNVLEWQKNLNALNSKEFLRKKMNIPLDKNIMLGIGNYTEKKNWISVIKLLPKLDNVFFILVGYGELEDEYKELIHKLNIEDKIWIVGRKNGQELLEFYKLSDFLIFPSFFDQFGFVVPEALASGLPVICTKNAGSSCLISNGKNGFLIDPNDINEKIIQKMISKKEGFANNIKSHMNRLTLENRVDEFDEIFNKVLLK